MTKKSKYMIKIDLASPEVIRSWSRGEVTKPETINYKTLKAEKDGLFDERIFGPTKNYECACGKYRKIKNKGKICERCGVEITDSIVRRERMGHIELEEPVSHIWMLKVAPSRIAAVTDIKTKDLEAVIYFVSYIVLDPGNSGHFNRGEVLNLGSDKSSNKTRETLIKVLQQILDNAQEDSLDHFRATHLIDELRNPSVPFSMDEAASFIGKHTGARFGIGAAAIEELLKGIDLDKEIAHIKEELTKHRGAVEQTKLMKRLEVLDSFKKSKARPEWMILRVISVIPPDIRPIIQLDGGRFTASEINDLYRKIIIRNERLKKAKAMGAPSIIVNNEKRMLQESVDALLDNERKARPVIGKDKRTLKSLTSILKGKQGRFRQNLLGKRVDYSARSVIAIGPSLKMYQAGIPRDMAITLFKPFVIRALQLEGLAENVKVAERMVQQNDPKVWDILEQVIKDRPILLNRAPTLHRLGIQAFEPKLVKGKAIRLHPLVTTAFNADFDGDQMAVHLPISPEAIGEARALMLGSKSILGPKDGKPIVTPTQDMILGNYYLTLEQKGVKGEGMIFASQDEAKLAYENEVLHLNALIGIPLDELKNKLLPKNVDVNKNYLLTTVGKIIFNTEFEELFPYINSNNIDAAEEALTDQIFGDDQDINEVIAKHEVLQPIKKKELSAIIYNYFRTYGSHGTAPMLDRMKDLGFWFSWKSGTTISAGDVVAYKDKYEEFVEADEKVTKINNYFDLGMLTQNEKKRRIIDVWTKVKDNISIKLEKILKQDPQNPVFIMADSGARGNVSNFTQLVGMRGLMNDTKGDIKEIPIKSSFREGLTVSEYFISTHGARKGMADIALKTADSGYLTRRLVDVSQEIVVVEEDCHPNKGFEVSAIIDTKHNSTIVSLHDRLLGRYLFDEVTDAKGNVIASRDELLTEELTEKIVQANVKNVVIRSVLTCDTNKGVCKKCYGINLATGKVVEFGEPVGVVAAQSIGEPGTQLTMRTFHTGGVFGDADITQGLPRIKELLDVTAPKGAVALISQIDGVVSEIQNEDSIYTIVVKSDNDERKYRSHYGAVLRVEEGDKVTRGQKLTEGAINIKDLLEVARLEDVQNYILKEVQKVYRLQGIEIADKYIEIIVRQMLSKVKIIDAGDTELLPGEIVSVKNYRSAITEAIVAEKKPPLAKYTIFGIKKVPLESDSWLSSASFQDTARVLVKTIIKGKVDKLEGLKENIMLGNLIPAGTGLTDPNEIIKRGQEVYDTEY